MIRRALLTAFLVAVFGTMTNVAIVRAPSTGLVSCCPHVEPATLGHPVELWDYR